MDDSPVPVEQHALVDSANVVSQAPAPVASETAEELVTAGATSTDEAIAATVDRSVGTTPDAPVLTPVQSIVLKVPPERINPGLTFSTPTEPWAPAWFYSALSALGTSFTASDGTTQSFGQVLCGSDVDPYEQLGATRLFCITQYGDTYLLGVSPDASSPAPIDGPLSFDATDEGILELFTALQKTTAFAAATYAYVPGGRRAYAATYVGPSLSSGYDPGTGLRSMVLGSAVTQVVPLATFDAMENTQIYNPSPVIVPIMTSLVYDITDNNTIGSPTYTLPVVYVLDQVTTGTVYVNKMAGPTVPNVGEPGYSASDPTAVVAGLTFTGSSPLAAFEQQKIAGFYVGEGWQDTLGTPIWDFGKSNAEFKAVTGTLTAPVKIFDPASSPLNGGTVAAAVSSLEQAQYLLSRDRLASMIASANERGEATAGAVVAPGVAATAASLSFEFPAPAVVTQVPEAQMTAEAAGEVVDQATETAGTPVAEPEPGTTATTGTASGSGVMTATIQVTDSSLFIFSNLDVDNGEVGQVSPSNVFAAGATINSAPTTGGAAAFVPNPFLLGLVRSVRMGSTEQYVFIPEDDSIEIGGIYYVVSVVQLDDLTLNPNSLPYPPSSWSQARYWQFANRHDPYLAVRYSGESEKARLTQAQEDIATIGLATSSIQEPMQMYLDTQAQGMSLWPIYGFPLTIETQTFNLASLASLNATILGLLKDPVLYQAAAATVTNLGEITVPSVLTQSNPYATSPDTVDASTTSRAGTVTSVVSGAAGTITIPGTEVLNLNPNAATDEVFAKTSESQQAVEVLSTQQQASTISESKLFTMTSLASQKREMPDTSETAASVLRPPQALYGFSAYSNTTGEAYLIEVVGADLTVPDQLPDPTEDGDYDPYYVRVVFLSNLTCYSMSVIVPSIAYDEHGYFAREAIEYDNLISKTDELGLGYMYSLFDSANNFDELRFIPYGLSAALAEREEEVAATTGNTPVVFTNTPYSTGQTAAFNPGIVFKDAFSEVDLEANDDPLVDRMAEVSTGASTEEHGADETPTAEPAEAPATEAQLDIPTKSETLNLNNLTFVIPPVPPRYFVCRRENWSAACHLMQATIPDNTSIYLAFGGGDIIPMRLDTPPVIDKRLPTHMNQLSFPFTNAVYASVETFSVANTPYVVAVSTEGGVPSYSSLSIDATAGTATVSTTTPVPLVFPSDIYVVGQASTTLTSMAALNSELGTTLISTGDFAGTDENGDTEATFAVVPYNNLVYLVRGVENVSALGTVAGTGITSGLLIDTFVPTSAGNLAPAQSARYKRSGLAFFGQSYTPTTMIDSLDNLDFTDIAGNTFFAPTIFVPIPELDATPGIVADIANFLGEEFWTFLYSEHSSAADTSVGGVKYPNGLNIDQDGKPILSLQKLQFVYDPTAVLFTPNDLTHKYPMPPKQQVLALSNGQVQEGICWRSANVQPDRRRPHNVRSQQILTTDGWDMDATNIVYSPSNRPVTTAAQTSYLGMSLHAIKSLSATTYLIEESAFGTDQTAVGFVSQVSSVQNMLVGVVFDYDNNDRGTLDVYDAATSNKGLVFVNGYLSGAGYAFSSPDHMDVNDVLPSELPLLEQVASTLGLGWDVAMYNVDVTLPREFWTFSYDTATAPSLPNFIPNVPPAPADPSFTNRTRSVLLNLENPIQPSQIGLMDTYSSVVSANLVLDNGVTGGVFLSKKADRNVASIGSNPGASATTFPLSGLPTKYDFFLFSRDHYDTLNGVQFLLVDQGYAMVLVDDGTGTGTKVAKYSVDADGNYYELFTYVLLSPETGVLETSTFPLKVTLGMPASPDTTPPTPETPNSVNPQDLVNQINSVSALIYAAFGASSPGQPPAFIPIQANSLGGVQAGTIMGQPGFSGYALNVVGQNHQPIQITQIFSGPTAYQIAGTTTVVPFNFAKEKAVPYYGSISHGLDKQFTTDSLVSGDGTVTIPRTTVPQAPTQGTFGGAGVGGLIGTPLSFAFQGSGAIPPASAPDVVPATTMKADDSIFYTANVPASTTMDSSGKAGAFAGGQYFVDNTDPANPIYGVVTLPKFTFNLNSYTVNISTTDPVTGEPRYTLVAGGQSYTFEAGNTKVTADLTTFTFNPVMGGTYSVTYAAIDAPAEAEAPTPIALTPFTVTMGGVPLLLDVFNLPGDLSNMVLGPIGRTYTYDAAAGTVTVNVAATASAPENSTPVTIETGLVFASASFYGYVVTIDAGVYSVNGTEVVSYSATTEGQPASYPIMTAPQIFTLDGNFYTFDQTASGTYASVTGAGQTILVNNDQFSINGQIYIIDTNVSPNTAIGAGNTYPMTDQNTQVEIDGVPYTITLKSGSLTGGSVSGQFDITQGNVVVIENFVYLLDTLNGQVVGNGLAYPLTTSGVTYDVTTAGNAFTVTAQQNEETSTIGNVDYVIGNTSVVADGVTYPILVYRSFVDGSDTYDIGLDGTVSTATTFTLSNNQFTDGSATYTTNLVAAFDGTTYYPMTGSPLTFTTASETYTIRTDGVAFLAGPTKTYLVPASGPSPNSFTFGTETITFGPTPALAAFDGTGYYAITSNSFVDSTGTTWTLSGNTAISEGNSYEIYSNLGTTPYFEVHGGATFQVNIPVADTGSATGDVYNVFPFVSNAFTMPVKYALTVSGDTASVQSVTYGADPVAVSSLTAHEGALTGGSFTDPVTGITYTVVVNGTTITVVDSSNTVVPFPQPGLTDTFVAEVVVNTAVALAVDSESTPLVVPVLNNQFIANDVIYTIAVTVASTDATSGPYYPVVNGRFVVPETAPASAITYVVAGSTVRRGYVLGTDDQFSTDGTVTYTVNEVNVVKTDSTPTLTDSGGTSTITDGSTTYQLDMTNNRATTTSDGVTFNQSGGTFTVDYPGGAVTYTLSGDAVTDSRSPEGSWPVTTPDATFTDSVSGLWFSFDSSGDGPVTVGFPYTNDFFTDELAGTTFFVDTTTSVVNVISYLPETTAYGFVAASGVTYLIHFHDVEVVFPVVSGPNVNVGVASVGNDQFDVHVDEVIPIGGGSAISTNANSFEINGNRYSIVGTPNGADYSACSVVGDAHAPIPFASASTFSLTDPTVLYTLQLGADDLPVAVTATFAVRPSEDVISVADDVYVITYATTTTGSLLGQGKAQIPITNSGFSLSNPLDSTKGTYVFADLDIYDASAVIGKFSIYSAPTFQMGSIIYTLDTVNLVVRDESKRPYPLISDPQMFSIAGANYVIDVNQVPHAIVGNETTSPLQTDVTIVDGKEIANSTFPLGGQIYRYVGDVASNLLCVTGTKLYPIALPEATFKLDSSLVFTLSLTPPEAGDYAGTTVPIGVITAGPTAAPTTTINLYAGLNESGGSAFFTYKGQLYTLVASGTTYVAVQKTATVYASVPAATQQQLAVFDMAGWTYLVTDGTTPGAATPGGINPGTLWSETSITSVESAFGLVYGLGATPTNVTVETLPSGATQYQFAVTAPTGLGGATAVTLYDVIYKPGSATNVVQVDVPALFPSFAQTADFTFTTAFPLSLETGGYNAFTFSVDPTALPAQSFAASYKTPVTSVDPALDALMGPQGDFSVEFWHSIPLTTPAGYHPFTYQSSGTPAASGATAPVNFIDVDFEDASDIYLQVNSTVMKATVVPPVFTSRWQHFALSYTQPYVMVCEGAGFGVQNGTNYNVEREFSINLTFSVSDATTMQGLVYKGSGGPIQSPEYVTSYSVYVEGGQLYLAFQDGAGTAHSFASPVGSIVADTFYEVTIVKQTQSPLGSTPDDASDPYAPPFSASDLSKMSSSGFTTDATLPSGGSGALSVSSIQPADTSTQSANLLTSIGQFSNQVIEVDFTIAEVYANGTTSTPVTTPITETVNNDVNLQIWPTGSSHLLFGTTYDATGTEYPLGAPGGSGNIRDVYIFGSAIGPNGIVTKNGTIPIAQASTEQLVGASICGYWQAAYDPNGIVQNPINQNDVAVSTNARLASLLPLQGYELAGTSLFINGAPMTLGLISSSSAPSSMTGRTTGSWFDINAGRYKIQEISMWQMARQQYQIIDDMFGRLVVGNEPTLVLYLDGSFSLSSADPPPLPLAAAIDSQPVTNDVKTYPIAFNNASKDLVGSPDIGRCGPLVTPNLYTPPGAALTVCDTPPSLTTYSVTVNSTTGTLAGEINEVYAYLKDSVLMLYAGKKVGDLVLSWVGQVQGDVQVMGFVEGAPPAPAANLTNKPSYAGATSLTFAATTSVSLKYGENTEHDWSNDLKFTGMAAFGVGGPAAGAATTTSTTATSSTGDEFQIKINISPMGAGAHMPAVKVNLGGSANATITWTGASGQNQTSSERLDELNRYVVKMEGSPAPYTGDLFMAGLNTVTVPETTPGVPAAKSPILPDPNLGGFTTSNPAGALPPHQPTEERFGQRMFQPSPYGQAFVTSQTEDIYQETLLQTNTVYGFVAVPNAQIPRDINIVSFRISSSYLRPGSLDGFITYGYNPATLPTGQKTYTTSTGEMDAVVDGNFSSGELGHNASYMRVVEAYTLKRQIDQEAFTALGIYNTAYNQSNPPDGNDPEFIPALDFYNEYVWTAGGGTEEVRHTYDTTYEEVLTSSSGTNWSANGIFDIKLAIGGAKVLNFGIGYGHSDKQTTKYSYSTGASEKFDVTASFDGIESDTQMRYSSNNDAHFVMRNNSMFNPANESGLNLVVGSDGLVYNIVPSVTSGAGLPVSDNIDTNFVYSQPQPSYATGNADGLSGLLEPYDRPGKTSQFRAFVYYLQPSPQNGIDFWETVVDQTWLANSTDADAVALRPANGVPSVPWRVFYRVTDSERYLPPLSSGVAATPQITPLMAVPVLEPATQFLFAQVNAETSGSATNPLNDIEANVVLVAPTSTGQSAGTTQATGPNTGLPIPPNNVIPFDLVKTAASIVSWGDSSNNKLLGALITSALGQNVVPMSRSVLEGSTVIGEIQNPAGGVLYTSYLDPNGFVVNVATDPSVTVFQDVNSNPISYFDGQEYHSLQADYVASGDGTILYYIQPPSTYDPSVQPLVGDYDLLGHPGDEWRYFLVSGTSSDMSADQTFSGTRPFVASSGAASFSGFTMATQQHDSSGNNQVNGYLIVKGLLQWPALNVNAESFADLSVYKAMSLLDTFPIGDPSTLAGFLNAAFPNSIVAGNSSISEVFARNIVTYLNTTQQGLIPQ